MSGQSQRQDKSVSKDPSRVFGVGIRERNLNYVASKLISINGSESAFAKAFEEVNQIQLEAKRLVAKRKLVQAATEEFQRDHCDFDGRGLEPDGRSGPGAKTDKSMDREITAIESRKKATLVSTDKVAFPNSIITSTMGVRAAVEEFGKVTEIISRQLDAVFYKTNEQGRTAINNLLPQLWEFSSVNYNRFESGAAQRLLAGASLLADTSRDLVQDTDVNKARIAGSVFSRDFYNLEQQYNQTLEAMTRLRAGLSVGKVLGADTGKMLVVLDRAIDHFRERVTNSMTKIYADKTLVEARITQSGENREQSASTKG